MRELRQALRSLRRQPGTTAVAILTLALGIGVNTAVFSVFESILVRPLPYPNATRLVSIAQAGSGRGAGISAWLAHEWTNQSTSIASIGLYTDAQIVLTGVGEPDVLRGQRVNAAFFDTLGVRPMLGRLFQADDDRSPPADVVVLGYELWSTRFGADPGVVGRTYTMNGAPYRVIGVLGAGFQPLRMTNAAEEPRIYAPLGYDAAAAARCRACGSLRAIGAIADAASIDRVRAEIAASMRQLRDVYPDDVGRMASIQVEPLRQYMTGTLRPALWLAVGSAVCVLLIACANLANLQLVRASARVGEFALRGALGSSRARLASHVLIESAIVAAAGCIGGVLLGRVSVHALVALAPRELPRLGEVGLDGRVLAAAILSGVVTAIAAAVGPALLAVRADLNDMLKGNAERSGGTRGGRLRGGLVVAQVALAFVLVAATGLLVRTVRGLLAVDAGFDAARVLTMTPVVLGTRDMGPGAMLREKRQIVDAVSALPGVTAAAMIDEVPLARTTPAALEIEGRPVAPGARPPTSDLFWVEGNYFDVMRIPLRRGRLLARHDGVDAPGAVVVGEAFARRHFSGVDPIGQRIRLDIGPRADEWLTIVGVVGDVRNLGLDRDADDAVYEPLAMNPGHYSRLVVRASGDPAILERPVRAAVQRIDPLVPIFHVQPMADYVASSMARQRFALALMTAFGGLALALAAIGLYGVLSYSVAARTAELGIRAALGATAGDLLMLVFKRGLALTGGGLAAGAILALWTTQSMTGLLFDVTAIDGPTFAVAAVVITLAAAAACYIPARRAANADPLAAIRT